MKKLFKKINRINASIAESKEAIQNIRAWEHQNAADLRELEGEKVRLEKAEAKKLRLLAQLEDAIRKERDTLLKPQGYAQAS